MDVLNSRDLGHQFLRCGLVLLGLGLADLLRRRVAARLRLLDLVISARRVSSSARSVARQRLQARAASARGRRPQGCSRIHLMSCMAGFLVGIGAKIKRDRCQKSPLPWGERVTERRRSRARSGEGESAYRESLAPSPGSRFATLQRSPPSLPQGRGKERVAPSTTNRKPYSAGLVAVSPESSAPPPPPAPAAAAAAAFFSTMRTDQIEPS